MFMCFVVSLATLYTLCGNKCCGEC